MSDPGSYELRGSCDKCGAPAAVRYRAGEAVAVFHVGNDPDRRCVATDLA